MKIRCFEDKDQDRWEEYVVSHPMGTPFHLIGWKRVIEKTFHHKSRYLVAEDTKQPTTTSQIRGILPIFIVKGFLFRRFLISIPFADYGGICADDLAVEAALLKEAEEITKREGLDYIELRNVKKGNNNLPLKELYVTFRKQIFGDLEENYKSIPRKQRRMIRQGEKYQLTSVIGGAELLKKFYKIFAHNVRNLGSPVYPVSFFKNSIREFGDACKIFLVNYNGKAVAGVMTFFYKDQVFLCHAGSFFEYRKYAVNDFMYWELMKYACENGYKVFDFGRSKVGTGSYDFKRHWGFQPQQLHYEYYLGKLNQIPNLSPANPKYKRVENFWKKLPLSLTKIIGPRIVKYIP